MRRWIAAVTALVMLMCCMPALAEYPEVRSAPLVYAKAARNGMVRVYLSSMGSVTSLDITVDGSYIADGAQDVNLTTGSTVNVAFSTSTGSITLTANGRTYAMGRELALRRRETSGTNGLRIRQAKKSGNLYPGDLHLIAQKSGGAYKLYPIVHVYMESYLCGVVPYEMGNSAHLEALKAQAVAARTYTLNKMNLRASGLYDVVDTTNDQVYYGNSDTTTRCTEAVMATKGIVLMNGSALTSTWYTASNGGQTESAKNCWGSSGYDYLVVKDDPFDLQNAASSVKTTTVYGQFAASGQSSGLRTLLTQKARSALGSGASVQRITAVTPHTPKFDAPSRLYTKVDFTLAATVNGASRTCTVTCDIFSELESLLGMSINASKNELWSVEKSGENFLLQARRYGHGVGMSQRGAMRMGALGYTYDQILGFYYENSTRMQHTFTHTILSGVTNEEVEYEEPPADITDPDAVYATVTLPGVEDHTALRAAQSASAAVLTYLTNGAIVTPLAKGGTWTKVRFGSLVGYVRTDALSFTGNAPSASDEAVTPVNRWATVRCSGTLNLRKTPSLSADVLTTMPNGEIVVVFSTKNGFANVQYGAHTGWASLDFLTLSSTYPGGQTESSDAAVTTDSVNMRSEPSMTAAVLMVIPKGASVTVTSNDGSWCGVKVGSVSGYVMASFLSFTDAPADTPEADEPAAPSAGEEAVVSTTADYAYVYDAPSDDAAVLGVMPRGDSVLVTRRGDVWCTVSLSGLTGYMRASELRFADSGDAAVIGYARVTTPSGSLNLRSGPQAGSDILTTIPRLTEVPVLAVQEGWSRVRYGGFTGWVMSSFLTMLGDAAPDAPQQTVIGYARVTTPSGSLNLRQTADSFAKVLTTIPRGTRIGVLARRSGWTQTSYAGYTGWVMDQFLTFEGSVTPAPAPQQPATPGDLPEAAPLPAQGWATVIGGGWLNLRETPSSRAKVLAQIPEAAQVQVLGRIDAWTQVRYEGVTGYVMSRYLSEAGDAPSSSGLTAVVDTASGGLNLRDRASADGKVLAIVPRNTRVTVLSRGSEWCKVVYTGQTGYVMTKFLRFDDAPADGGVSGGVSVRDAWVDTPSGLLNVREEPSTDARVLCQLEKGTQVSRLSDDGTWSKIRVNGQDGYVQSRYLSDQAVATTGGQTVASGGVRYVATPSGSLNLRDAPSTEGYIIAAIPRGERVTLLEEDGAWSLVGYSGLQGWVKSEFLSRTPPAAEAEEDEEEEEDAPADASTPVYDPTLREADDLPGFIVPDAENAMMFKWCSEDAPVTAVLHGQDSITVTQQGDTWCRVRFNEKEGYVLTEYVRTSGILMEAR